MEFDRTVQDEPALLEGSVDMHRRPWAVSRADVLNHRESVAAPLRAPLYDHSISANGERPPLSRPERDSATESTHPCPPSSPWPSAGGSTASKGDPIRGRGGLTSSQGYHRIEWPTWLSPLESKMAGPTGQS